MGRVGSCAPAVALLRRRASLLVALALGCSDAPWSEGSSRSCSEVHDGFDDCCCLSSAEELCYGEGATCAISVQCTEDAWIDGQGCPLVGPASVGTVIVEEEGVECALQALRNADADLVSWAMQSRIGLPAPTNEISRALYFTATSREVYVVTRGFTDGTSPPPDEATARRSLRPPSFFEACALESTSLARFACLRDAVEGPDLEVCEGL